MHVFSCLQLYHRCRFSCRITPRNGPAPSEVRLLLPGIIITSSFPPPPSHPREPLLCSPSTILFPLFSSHYLTATAQPLELCLGQMTDTTKIISREKLFFFKISSGKMKDSGVDLQTVLLHCSISS